MKKFGDWFIKDFRIIVVGDMSKDWDKSAWQGDCDNYSLRGITVCSLLPDYPTRYSALLSENEIDPDLDSKVIIFIINIDDSHRINIKKKHFQGIANDSIFCIVISDTVDWRQNNIFHEADVLFSISKNDQIRAILDIVISVSNYGLTNFKIDPDLTCIFRNRKIQADTHNQGIAYMIEINNREVESVNLPIEVNKFGKMFLNITGPETLGLSGFHHILDKIKNIPANIDMSLSLVSPPNWANDHPVFISAYCMGEPQEPIKETSHRKNVKRDRTVSCKYDDIPSFLRPNKL